MSIGTISTFVVADASAGANDLAAAACKARGAFMASSPPASICLIISWSGDVFVRLSPAAFHRFRGERPGTDGIVPNCKLSQQPCQKKSLKWGGGVQS